MTDRETLARHGHAIGGLKSQQKYLREEMGRGRAALEGVLAEFALWQGRQERAEFRVLLVGITLAAFLATLLLGRAFG